MSSEREEERGRVRADAAEVAAQDAGLVDAEDGIDEEELEVPRDVWATVRRLWRTASDQHWRFYVVMASIVCYVALSIAAPAYSAYLIDLLWGKIQAAFAGEQPFSVTWEDGGRQILVYLLIWTAAWVFYSLQCFTMASFAERLNLRLRNAVGDKLARLPLAYFDAHKPGEIISRTTNDLDKMSEVLQTGLLRLLTAVGMVTGSLVMMLRYDVLLTGVFLVFAVLSTFVTKFVAKKTLYLAAERQRCTGILTGQVEEAYSGRTIIKAFNCERRSSARIHEATQQLAEATRKADFITNAINPLIRSVIRLSQVIIAVLAGRMLIQGSLSVGMFQAFFQYVYQASEPLSQMSFTINTLQSALASAERVFDILDEGEIEPEPAEPARLPGAGEALAARPAGRVAFEHVRFGYDPEEPLMHDVSFVAEPGRKIAIVGETGAGKTTLVNLLMRFYEIDGGHITLDGVDTRQMARADLRRNFGMVLQDAWIFDGTVAENIAYGRPDATREEIVAAAKMAHVDFFVRTMSHGYETRLTSDGENLSQGQRQLITIARVFLCDPSILILDEATSNVDTRTERAIVESMERLMHGRTSFVIAHRLSTIVDADLILLMSHGTIVEQGTHEELLAAGGAYADLYLSQFA